MIRAIIFDLDNCLSAADEPGQQLLEPVFAAIRGQNHGRLSGESLEKVYFDCWRHPLDWVAAKHGFTKEMLAAAWDACVGIEVSAPMHGYRDLAILPRLEAMRFLVTSGFRRLQESKVRALGFAPCFTSIHIDAIDEPGRVGKREIFAQLLRDHALVPREVLVVGDNPDSEIEAGNQLGIPTVQILRPGVPPGQNATHTIRSLTEIPPLLAGS
jgi:putative hydrolase of the HAD superfamily